MRTWAEPDGMAGLSVHSTAQDIATIFEALTALAEAATSTDDARTLDNRRADVLADICADILARGGWRDTLLAERHGRPLHVYVVVPLDALVGGDSPAELAGHGWITAGQARDIAADASLTRLVCDPLSGQLLDYGRTKYPPPQHLADFVVARDQRCAAPGCLTAAARCDIDHRIPFSDPAGRTSADALKTLCRHHHRGKDGGGFNLTKNDIGDYHWTTPLGRSYIRKATQLWTEPGTYDRPDGSRHADLRTPDAELVSDEPPF